MVKSPIPEYFNSPNKPQIMPTANRKPKKKRKGKQTTLMCENGILFPYKTPLFSFGRNCPKCVLISCELHQNMVSMVSFGMHSQLIYEKFT